MLLINHKGVTRDEPHTLSRYIVRWFWVARIRASYDKRHNAADRLSLIKRDKIKLCTGQGQLERDELTVRIWERDEELSAAIRLGGRVLLEGALLLPDRLQGHSRKTFKCKIR